MLSYDKTRDRVAPKLIGPLAGVHAGNGAVVLTSESDLSRVGIASATTHLGEAVQGPIIHEQREKTALITLPDPTRWSRAVVRVTPGSGCVAVSDRSKKKVKRAAEMIFRRAGAGDVDIHVGIASNIPSGVGAGSSTADITATVRAASAALDLPLTDLEVAQVVFASEGPCDPLPFNHWGVTTSWFSRAGKIYEIIPKPLPRMVIVGCVTDATSSVDTNQQASHTNYDTYEIRAFEKVYSRARRAILRGSAADLVRAAEDSLDANQSRCTTPRLQTLRNIADGMRALGVLASHSGSVAAIAFDGEAEGNRGRIAETAAVLEHVGCIDVHVFSTPGGAP